MTSTTAAPSTTGRSPAYNIVIGLTTLVIFLQSVWAGIFLEHDGARDEAGTWIDVHNIGGSVATLLGIVALVLAVVQLRSRRDLLVGTAVLVVLLILQVIIGSLIKEASKDVLTAVHVPLAMVVMAVAVWLPLRARQGAPSAV